MKPQTKYLLHLQEPCARNWSEMRPAKGGKFCQSCSKTVIDFTVLSDNQIVSLLEKANGQSLCAKLKTEQLHRVMAQTEPVKANLFYKYLAGVLLLGSVEAATAQTTMPQEVPMAERPLKTGLTSVEKVQDALAQSLEKQPEAMETKGEMTLVVLGGISAIPVRKAEPMIVIDGDLTDSPKILEKIPAARIKSISVLKSDTANRRETIVVTTDLTDSEKKRLKLFSKN